MSCLDMTCLKMIPYFPVKKMRIPTYLLFCIFSFLSVQGNAQLGLPKIFSDHMVLQQKAPIPIWGWAEAGQKVKVQLAGQEVEVKAGKNGKWEAQLKPLEAGGPYVLKVSSRKEKLEVQDILCGEVWLCSGQSNMEYTLQMLDKEEAIQAADNPNLRLFTVARKVAFQPLDDLEVGEWTLTTPESIADFSAVAYFFGKKLQEELKVPVGLIHSSWGGTVVETWMSAASAQQVPYYKKHVEDLKEFDIAQFQKAARAKYEKIIQTTGEDLPDGLQNGQALWAAADYDDNKWGSMDLPGLWESQGMTELDGVVWYRKTIDLPSEVASKNMSLSLGPIDDDDLTYVNGHLVGSMTQKYNVPRVYQVPATYLKAGKNVITIRVNDTGGGGGLHGMEEQLFIESDGFKKSLAGPWKFRISPGLFKVNASGTAPNDHPTVLFNGMIHPILPYAVQGVIWYQGESNADRAYEYRKLFPMLIQDWRQYLSEDLDFYWVQLANFMAPQPAPGPSNWAELREAQTMALELPKTGMAVAIDIGEADDIHPKNKEDVGLRLALNALYKNYGKKVVYAGPMYKDMRIEGNKITLSFDHIGSGLVAKDQYGYLKSFTIAGADQQFHWAQARIVGNQIEVFSPEVDKPVAVRYAWADNPDDANLYNKEGLPASPFRTDNWKGKTEGVVKKY